MATVFRLSRIEIPDPKYGSYYGLVCEPWGGGALTAERFAADLHIGIDETYGTVVLDELEEGVYPGNASYSEESSPVFDLRVSVNAVDFPPRFDDPPEGAWPFFVRFNCDAAFVEALRDNGWHVYFELFSASVGETYRVSVSTTALPEPEGFWTNFRECSEE